MGLVSPVHHLKFYAPASMLFLGFGAWFFFRQLRFAPVVCALGGLGAGLNMHFLSNACWGLGQWNVCCGMVLIARPCARARRCWRAGWWSCPPS